jgi:hypothetical protein
VYKYYLEIICFHFTQRENKIEQNELQLFIYSNIIVVITPREIISTTGKDNNEITFGSEVCTMDSICMF